MTGQCNKRSMERVRDFFSFSQRACVWILDGLRGLFRRKPSKGCRCLIPVSDGYYCLISRINVVPRLVPPISKYKIILVTIMIILFINNVEARIGMHLF
jgi:hypothetical protein